MSFVGFIDLGLMGKPMVTRLLKGGYGLVAYNRSHKPAEELVALGATPASSPVKWPSIRNSSSRCCPTI